MCSRIAVGRERPEKRSVESGQRAVADPTVHDFFQDIASAVICGQDSIADQDCGGLEAINF